MKECWINVYGFAQEQIYGLVFYNRLEAQSEGRAITGVKYLYRIHVKMDGGYNKRNAYLNAIKYRQIKPKWENIKIYDPRKSPRNGPSKNWMEF